MLMSCGGSLISYEKPIFPATSTLTYTVICDTTTFNYPFQLLVFDSLLIVRASDRTDNFHIYNKENGKKIRSFYSFGKGPIEGVNPRSLVHLKGSKFAIQEINLRKIVVVDLEKLLKNEKEYFSEIRVARENNNNALTTDYYVYLGENRFLGSGWGISGCRFHIVNTKSDEDRVKLYDIYPKAIDENEEYNMVIYKYANSVAISPDGKKMVNLTLIGGIGETFNIESDTMQLRVCKGFHKPVYRKLTSGTPWLTGNDDTTYGFCDAFATNDYIYAIYDGAKDSDDKNKTIAVFDWDLNPVMLYELKDEILKLAFDSAAGYVYGVIKDVETSELKIIRFDEKFAN